MTLLPDEDAATRMTAEEYAHYIRTGNRGDKHLPTPDDHDEATRTPNHRSHGS